MSIKDQMNKIYRDKVPDEIPWNLSQPPNLLKKLIESQRITPCNTIDIGCGAGNYSIYLAQQGFKVTGIDLSSVAIDLARSNAAARGVECEFKVFNVVEDEPFDQKFDFAFEWEVMHHIFPPDRERYLAHVAGCLNPGATYLSVHFSFEDNQFGADTQYHNTPFGTELYFSTKQEMQTLYSSFFQIDELKLVDIDGKFNKHKVVFALLTRK